MPDSNEAEKGDVEMSLSPRQVLLAGLIGIVIMFFSATGTLYLQQPPEERSPLQLIYPFEHGPSAEALHQKGVKKFQEGKYGQAARNFSRSLDKDSNNAKGLFLLASAQGKQGNFEEGLRQLELLEESGFDLDRVPIKKAYWLLGLGRYEEARRTARAYVDRSSPSAQNKIYGYLILYTVARLQGGDPAPERIRSEVKSLELDRTQWPGRLFEHMVEDAEGAPSDVNDRARETEYRAWKAMLSWGEGKDATAREHREWVLREGDPSVYEYDLMLATRSSDLFGTGY